MSRKEFSKPFYGLSLRDLTHTTICFKGCAKDIPGNPFDIASPFGKVSIISIGDVFKELDEAQDEIARLQELLR